MKADEKSFNEKKESAEAKLPLEWNIHKIFKELQKNMES